MDVALAMKEEPVWDEPAPSTSLENLEHVLEMVSVKEEVKSELTMPGQTPENPFEPPADIKGEIFIEEQTIDQSVAYMKEENKSRPEVNRTDPPPSLGPTCFKCDLCGKVLASKTSILRHLKGHTGNRSLKCDHCHKNFTHNSTLLDHIRSHTGEKPYRCTVCGKSFSRSSNLSQHNRKHTGLKPYECSVCNKTFTESGTLANHMRLHTGEKPYRCTICSMQFSQRCSLSKHMMVHKGERPFRCVVCTKSFTQRHHLQIGSIPNWKRQIRQYVELCRLSCHSIDWFDMTLHAPYALLSFSFLYIY